MKTIFEALIEEFNETVGENSGIFVQTTYIADASDLNERLLAALEDEIGSPELPDLAVIYPRVGVTLAEKGLLMDISTQFSAGELARYVPAFLEEGKMGGDTLYIMPVAKSTEIMYVNTTIFDRFAADTDVTLAQLATFEGVIDAAKKYYEWSGGKAFVHYADPFNNAMIGYKQLGGEFIVDNGLNLASPTYNRVWDAYYPLAVRGGAAIFDNYADLLFASGEIICGIGTSASVTYFADMVTYADNTKEIMEFALLPLPVFEGGEKVTLQRGAGMCVFKSDGKKEFASGVFMKWLTEPEQNLRFTTPLGYMPVTESAMDELMARWLGDIENENIRKLYEMFAQKQNEYTFYFPAVFDGFEEMQRNYNQSLRNTAENSWNEYTGLLNAQAPDAAYEIVSRGVFERFVAEHGGHSP
jgi:multiple sugar transport system substrate-binding protein